MFLLVPTAKSLVVSWGYWLNPGAKLELLIIALILWFATPSVFHEIHWIRYGYDEVWYHSRTYVNPTTYTGQEAESKFGQGQLLIPTGDKVIGLPVYDTTRSLALHKRMHVVSTLLLLKKPNGNFIVYGLSGGP